jgi:hypothetical protein
MGVAEQNRGVRHGLTRLIAKRSDAMQRDQLRSVLLMLQGRLALEVTDAVGRSRRYVQRKRMPLICHSARWSAVL